MFAEPSSIPSGRGKVGDALRRGWQGAKKFAKDNRLGSKLVDAAGDALKGFAPELAPLTGIAKNYVASKGYGGVLPGGHTGYGKKKKKKKSKSSKKTSSSKVRGPSSSVGTKLQVYNGTARHTPGGLTRSSLMKNKRGKIVSKAKHSNGLKAMKYLKSFRKH